MSIIPQSKQLTFWEYIQSPSEGGNEKVKSHRTEPQVGSYDVPRELSRTKGGHRRFLKREIERFAGIELPTTTVCYAKVSSYSQRDDARADNLNICAPTIQRRNSFHKLESSLILDGENLSPFWN